MQSGNGVPSSQISLVSKATLLCEWVGAEATEAQRLQPAMPVVQLPEWELDRDEFTRILATLA